MTKKTPHKVSDLPLDRWIDEKEASAITGMSLAWFQRARWAGDGIPYAKISRAVRYKIADVQRWMDERRVTSTSQDKV
jgi:predicted DNA-binding transcriptional regulator AlpA